MEKANGLLETAYIEFIDCRNNNKGDVTTAQTKSMLSGVAEHKKPVLQTSTLKVQFNPNSLKFTAAGNMKPKKKKGITQKDDKVVDCLLPSEPCKMNLQIQLVFERDETYHFGVAPEVDGFLGLIKNPFTRQISFNWGEMHYKGQVNNVNAEYKMFNSKGIPMRASVNFTIELQL